MEQEAPFSEGPFSEQEKERVPPNLEESLQQFQVALGMALDVGVDPTLTLLEAAVSEKLFVAFLDKHKTDKQSPSQTLAAFIREGDTQDSPSPFASPTVRSFLSKARRARRLGLDLFGLDEIAKATALTPGKGRPRRKPWHAIALRVIQKYGSAMLECLDLTRAAFQEAARENRRGSETTAQEVLKARLRRDPELVESILRMRPDLRRSGHSGKFSIPQLANALLLEKAHFERKYRTYREIKRALGLTKEGERSLRSQPRNRGNK